MRAKELLRIARVFRLIKLIRLVRAARVITRWKARVTIPYATMRLASCLLQVVLFAHWEACCMMLLSSFASNPTDTYLGDLEYCRPAGVINLTLPSGSHLAKGMYCRGWAELYLASISWSLLVITGTGGADAYPRVQDAKETAVVTLLVLVSAVVWTNVLATFCDIVTNADPVSTKFHQDMERMNEYMDKIKVPEPMRRRVREYLYHSVFEQESKEDILTTELLSPTLRSDLIQASPSFGWLWNIFIFRGCEPSFLVLLPRHMIPKVFAPMEVPEDGRFYVLNKGVVVLAGKLLSSGKTWGESMLVARPHLQALQVARAMTFIETFSIDRSTLYRLAMFFPQSEKVLAKRAMLLAIKEHLRKVVHEERGQKRKGSAGNIEDANALATPPATLQMSTILSSKLLDVSNRQRVIHRDTTNFQFSTNRCSNESGMGGPEGVNKSDAIKLDAMDEKLNRVHHLLENVAAWQAKFSASQADFSRLHHQSMSTMLSLHESMSTMLKLLLKQEGTAPPPTGVPVLMSSLGHTSSLPESPVARGRLTSSRGKSTATPSNILESSLGHTSSLPASPVARGRLTSSCGKSTATPSNILEF